MSKFKTDAQRLKLARRLHDKRRGKAQARLQYQIAQRDRLMEAPALPQLRKDPYAQ